MDPLIKRTIGPGRWFNNLRYPAPKNGEWSCERLARQIRRKIRDLLSLSMWTENSTPPEDFTGLKQTLDKLEELLREVEDDWEQKSRSSRDYRLSRAEGPAQLEHVERWLHLRPIVLIQP